MPVRSRDMINPMGLMDDYSAMPSSSVDVDALYPNTELLLSDDIWKKFELDFPEFSGFEDIFEEIDATRTDATQGPILSPDDICEIRNHDCMWAGHCGSKEHPVDEPRIHAHCAATPGPSKAPVPLKQENNKQPTSSQQSLLKPTIRVASSANPMMPNVHTPQTPPMSDDEDVKSKPTKVLQILNQAISECDLEDDSDLCEYFEDEELEVNVTGPEVKEEADDKPNIRSYQFAAVNDHSYHKDKNASMHMANLGIDTPSDSEEEIDVVSVGAEKQSLNSRMVSSLPNNPSNRDRQQIQRRMATAISKNRMSHGIKTILPIRKVGSPENSPVKRKMPESRVIKRSRQYRMTPTAIPYKKRTAAYGNSSDSEPEPSEKRSLHNNMERQRRIDLRNAFEDLRILVPEVSKKERAAKVVILREAAQYCDFLGNMSLNCTRQLDELRLQQERLRGRVSQLRRSLAAKR